MDRLQSMPVRNTARSSSVELDYGDQTITLRRGDSAYFDAAVSHSFRSVSTASAEVVVVADGYNSAEVSHTQRQV